MNFDDTIDKDFWIKHHKIEIPKYEEKIKRYNLLLEKAVLRHNHKHIKMYKKDIEFLEEQIKVNKHYIKE